MITLLSILEVGNFGGRLAGLGIIALLVGLLIIVISLFSLIVLGIMSASNKEKKYSFKAPLIGVLVGVLLLIAGGCICGSGI